MLIILTCLYVCVFTFSIVIVLSSTPIYSVLSLILSILSIAFILFLLGFEFLPYLILIVYIGAVAVLFIFVTMLINVNVFFKKEYLYFDTLFFPLIFVKTLTLFYLILCDIGNLSQLSYSTLWLSNFINYNHSDVILFGNSLYYEFSVYTIITSFLLFIGMIGSISICLSNKNLY